MSRYFPEDVVLNEIRDIQDQVQSSQQVSFLKDSERAHWQKLVDSNIRAGTLACMWCLKAQCVKKLAAAFNKWRLVSVIEAQGAPRSSSPRRAASAALQDAMRALQRHRPTGATPIPTPAPTPSSLPVHHRMPSPSSSRLVESLLEEGGLTSARGRGPVASAFRDRAGATGSEHNRSFLELSNTLLTQADAETKRQKLLDLSYDIMARNAPSSAHPSQPLPEPPLSPISMDHSAARHSSHRYSGAQTQQQQRYGDFPPAPPSPADFFSRPRPTPSAAPPELRIRRNAGGDFVRDLLASSPSPSPSSRSARSPHRVSSLRAAAAQPTSSSSQAALPSYLQFTSAYMKKRQAQPLPRSSPPSRSVASQQRRGSATTATATATSSSQHHSDRNSHSASISTSHRKPSPVKSSVDVDEEFLGQQTRDPNTTSTSASSSRGRTTQQQNALPVAAAARGRSRDRSTERSAGPGRPGKGAAALEKAQLQLLYGELHGYEGPQAWLHSLRK